LDRTFTKTEKWQRMREILRIFLKLGTVAFGGPAAHVAMMNDELVRKRKWLTEEEFLELMSATNVIPGPNSTELAIYIGLKRAGWWGFWVAGVAFILPAMLIVLAFAVMYERMGHLPDVKGVLSGIQPVVLAVIVQALWGLGKKAIKDGWTLGVAVGAAGLAGVGWQEWWLLFLGALFMWWVRERVERGRWFSLSPLPVWLASGADQAVSQISLGSLFFQFVKIGAILFGSGYVLIAFLEDDFVKTGLITSEQLMDAVAVGQMTPGPLFTTATFIGYLLEGVPGAVLSTVAIFLPAFAMVALIHRVLDGVKASPWAKGALEGLHAVSLALMALASFQLGREALYDWTRFALFAIAFITLTRWRVSAVWLILAGGLLGWAMETW